MSCEILDEALKEKALTACKDYLGGQWSKISTSEFRLTEVK